MKAYGLIAIAAVMMFGCGLSTEPERSPAPGVEFWDPQDPLPPGGVGFSVSGAEGSDVVLRFRQGARDLEIPLNNPVSLRVEYAIAFTIRGEVNNLPIDGVTMHLVGGGEHTFTYAEYDTTYWSRATLLYGGKDLTVLTAAPGPVRDITFAVPDHGQNGVALIAPFTEWQSAALTREGGWWRLTTKLFIQNPPVRCNLVGNKGTDHEEWYPLDLGRTLPRIDGEDWPWGVFLPCDGRPDQICGFWSTFIVRAVGIDPFGEDLTGTSIDIDWGS